MKNSNLFLLINTLSGMGYSLAAPLFPSLSNSELLTEEILGWIISTYSLAGTILTPFVPFLTNKFNRVTLLIISTSLEATCTLLYGFLNYVDNFYVLLIIIFILRTIHGLCSAIIGVLVYSLTISLTEENELELALGNLEIGWSIGTSSGPLFASFFYGFGGYSLPFILLGLILFISVYLSNSIHSDRLLANDDADQNPSFIRFLKYPKIFLILIGFIVVWDYDKIFIRESEASFETMITVLLFIGFSFLIGWSVIGIFSSQMLCFIIGFSFFYSVFWMFLRRKAYDKTTELFKVNKCIGYHPVYYLFLGGITGIILFGFSAILLNNLLNEGIYFIYLFGILISFIIESLILSPDIMNKVLPFEVRKKSGFILYSILTVVLSVIFCMLMNFFI